MNTKMSLLPEHRAALRALLYRTKPAVAAAIVGIDQRTLAKAAEGAPVAHCIREKVINALPLLPPAASSEAESKPAS